MVPPFLSYAVRHNSTYAVSLLVEETAPPGNGKVPVSFSLTLSGGFDVASIADFHSPGSLLDDSPVY